MPPIWDEPLMLALFILIALSLAAYVYIMLFVARFGSRQVQPQGRRSRWVTRAFLTLIPILVLIAVVLIFVVQYTFIETFNGTYTGVEARSRPLHYSERRSIGNMTYYLFWVNTLQKSENLVQGNISEKVGYGIDLYVFDDTG